MLQRQGTPSDRCYYKMINIASSHCSSGDRILATVNPIARIPYRPGYIFYSIILKEGTARIEKIGWKWFIIHHTALCKFRSASSYMTLQCQVTCLYVFFLRCLKNWTAFCNLWCEYLQRNYSGLIIPCMNASQARELVSLQNSPFTKHAFEGMRTLHPAWHKYKLCFDLLIHSYIENPFCIFT